VDGRAIILNWLHAPTAIQHIMNALNVEAEQINFKEYQKKKGGG
jgi:hypothetical protein